METRGREPLSVADAVLAAKGAVEELPPMAVRGEVSGFRGPNARSGHCYFNVKDDASSMAVIAWKGVYQTFLREGYELRDGLEIVLHGGFQVYQGTGKLSFVARRLELAGEGALRQKVAALARKLEAEGLMDPARKRLIPPFCTRVCVVTSLSGSVIEDVRRTLARRNPLVELDCVGCSVQGTEAPATIIRALARAAASRPDAILLVRGGGSFEDLMCFNDEALARAVAACPVPVITGIGHEPDVSICDMVADRRCSTPTAAAESVAPDMADLQRLTEQRARRLAKAAQDAVVANGQGLDAQERLMRKSLGGEVARMRQRVESLASHRCIQDPRYMVDRRGEELLQTEQRLVDALPRLFERSGRDLDDKGLRLRRTLPRVVARRREDVGRDERLVAGVGARLLRPYEEGLGRAAASLDALSPLRVLGRGYALARDTRGHVVTDAAKLAVGDSVSVALAHGGFRASVTGLLDDEGQSGVAARGED